MRQTATVAHASIVKPLRKFNYDEETNEKRSIDSRHESVGQYIGSGAGYREQYRIVQQHQSNR
jgi:hypothetical protein